MATFRFTKQAKLIKTDDFSSVFNFRKRISAQHLAIHYQPNTLPHARLGLVIGKKNRQVSRKPELYAARFARVIQAAATRNLPG